MLVIESGLPDCMAYSVPLLWRHFIKDLSAYVNEFIVGLQHPHFSLGGGGWGVEEQQHPS